MFDAKFCLPGHSKDTFGLAISSVKYVWLKVIHGISYIAVASYHYALGIKINKRCTNY